MLGLTAESARGRAPAESGGVRAPAESAGGRASDGGALYVTCSGAFCADAGGALAGHTGSCHTKAFVAPAAGGPPDDAAPPDVPIYIV